MCGSIEACLKCLNTDTCDKPEMDFEIQMSESIDKEERIEDMDFDHRRKYLAQRKYEASPKGKEMRKRYRGTDGYKTSQARYRATEQAKEKARERSRRCYHKKKAMEKHGRAVICDGIG